MRNIVNILSHVFASLHIAFLVYLTFLLLVLLSSPSRSPFISCPFRKFLASPLHKEAADSLVGSGVHLRPQEGALGPAGRLAGNPRAHEVSSGSRIPGQVKRG